MDIAKLLLIVAAGVELRFCLDAIPVSWMKLLFKFLLQGQGLKPSEVAMWGFASMAQAVENHIVRKIVMNTHRQQSASCTPAADPKGQPEYAAQKHQAYVRISEDADTAVLFIHGIVGTPRHFQKFLPLVPQNMTVYNVLLDGHGRGVRDFSRSSMEKWEAQIRSVVEELAANHKRLYLVAHSLGTLLAMEQAVVNPKIAGLFLLAVPLRLSVKWRLPVNCFKVFFDRIDPSDAAALAARECYGIERDKNLLHYLGWLPRYWELFSKMREARKQLGALSTPSFVYQSGQDEMLARSSLKYLQANPCMQVCELKASGHYYYDPQDMQFLLDEFCRFLREPSHSAW